MTQRTLLVVSLFFGFIPLAGELFLWFSSGSFNPTIFAAVGIALFLGANLIALQFHKRILWAQIVLCSTLALGVAVAIAADGGINSPLWFFQLLVIFGAGVIFGKNGVLIFGALTLVMAIAYYFTSDLSSDLSDLAELTSVVASTALFTALSYLYARDKEYISRQAAELLSANEELRQFAYRTSHDLRSPLVSIKNLAALIKEDLEDGEIDEAIENTERIGSRAETLEKLVVDILDLARADLSELSPHPLDLAGVIQEIIDRLPAADTKKAIQIDTDLRHTGELRLPKARVIQILENLISNAQQYLDPSKSHHYVKIASIDRQNSVEITVQDNGLGIEEQYADRVFGMFQRFHPHVAAGSGLGLYIVKKHVDKLGANISYRRTGDGSLFSLMVKRSVFNP